MRFVSLLTRQGSGPRLRHAHRARTFWPSSRSFSRGQQGLALWWIALMGVVLVLGIAYGSRVVGPYYDHYAMARVVHGVLVEAQQQNLSTPEIKDRLIKRFQINDLNVAVEDIDVENNDGTVVIDIDKQVQVPLYGNASLNLDLSVHQSSADLSP